MTRMASRGSRRGSGGRLRSRILQSSACYFSASFTSRGGIGGVVAGSSTLAHVQCDVQQCLVHGKWDQMRYLYFAPVYLLSRHGRCFSPPSTKAPPAYA